jgi:hypothetical protein
MGPNKPFPACESPTSVDGGDRPRAKPRTATTGERAALLISCSQHDVQVIRERAEQQRRKISSYLLNILMNAVEFDEELLGGSACLAKLGGESPSPGLDGFRATVLLRCSEDDAQRIRAAAKRRDVSISGYVRYVLRRSWEIADKCRESMHSRLAHREAIKRQEEKTPPPPGRLASGS